MYGLNKIILRMEKRVLGYQLKLKTLLTFQLNASVIIRVKAFS